ncbi:MAG: 50S ribosomal protein L11 methyltransferase [Vicinamibacterales bacterium]
MPHPPRTWPALDIRLREPGTRAPSFEDRLAVLLDDLQPIAIDANEATGLWRVYFDEPYARDAAMASLAAELMDECLVTSLDEEDEGWVYKVQENLRAITVGRITVAPPWDVPEAHGADSVVVVIEPSMGFGTGHHQSTRLCLAALQELPVDGCRVIDAGTGSGVLALAARLLHSGEVTAFDNDADSVAAAQGNSRLNGLAPDLVVAQASLNDVDFVPADIVTANLTASILTSYAATLTRLVAPGGYLIVSGFTTNQVDGVREAFTSLMVERELQEDDWVALVLRSSS